MKKEYYVYILQDSTEKLPTKDKYGLMYRPFYVGKGYGNRSNIHVYNAERNNYSHNYKLLKEILDINTKGGKVIISQIAKSSDEDKMYEAEKSAILFYGLRHKGGILVNAGSGIAGGWGADRNPTYVRMNEGTHNFLTSNPQTTNPKLIYLSTLVKSVDSKGIDIVKEGWMDKASYASVKALKLGILRLITRDKLPYTLTGTLLKRN